MSARRHERVAFVLAAGLLVLLVALASANAVDATFTYDDKVEVVGNRTIRSLASWRAVLGYNTSRPLAILSWALDWRLWRLDPRGYHAVNIGIHALNAVLALFLGGAVAACLGARRAVVPALAAAALWAVHPLTTEAVTYITGRSESLCATFYLGAVLAWLCWRRGGDWILLLVAFLSFLAASATKEVAATLPAALLAAEVALPGLPRRTWRAPAALLPFWAVLGGALVARKLTLGVFTTDLWLRPLPVQVATQLEVHVRYLALWLLPRGQSVFHDHPPAAGLLATGPLLALALLGAALAGAWWVRRRQPAALLGLGWWLLLLVPSSSIIPLKETMAEHRTYLAGWGLCLGLVLACAPLARRWPRAALGAAIAAVLALGAATQHRNGLWRTEIALWRQATEHNPRSAEAWYGYGDALRFGGSYDEAVGAYREAIARDDQFLDAWNNLGIALAEQGARDDARAVWLQTLERHPSYCKAHNNLGWLAYRQEDWDDALAEFRTTLTYCPRNTQAHFALGNIYFAPRRDPRRALHHYEAVLELDPAFSDRALVEQRIRQLTF